jgi:hypothetical protein
MEAITHGSARCSPGPETGAQACNPLGDSGCQPRAICALRLEAHNRMEGLCLNLWGQMDSPRRILLVAPPYIRVSQTLSPRHGRPVTENTRAGYQSGIISMLCSALRRKSFCLLMRGFVTCTGRESNTFLCRSNGSRKPSGLYYGSYHSRPATTQLLLNARKTLQYIPQ